MQKESSAITAELSILPQNILNFFRIYLVEANHDLANPNHFYRCFDRAPSGKDEMIVPSRYALTILSVSILFCCISFYN